MSQSSGWYIFAKSITPQMLLSCLVVEETMDLEYWYLVIPSLNTLKYLVDNIPAVSEVIEVVLGTLARGSDGNGTRFFPNKMKADASDMKKATPPTEVIVKDLLMVSKEVVTVSNIPANAYAAFIWAVISLAIELVLYIPLGIVMVPVVPRAVLMTKVLLPLFTLFNFGTMAFISRTYRALGTLDCRSTTNAKGFPDNLSSESMTMTDLLFDSVLTKGGIYPNLPS